jgi:hypothetical protein
MLKQVRYSKVLSLIVLFFCIGGISVFAASEPVTETINQTRPSVKLIYPTDAFRAKAEVRTDILNSTTYDYETTRKDSNVGADLLHVKGISLREEGGKFILRYVNGKVYVYKGGRTEALTYTEFPMKYISSVDKEVVTIEIFYPTEKSKVVGKNAFWMSIDPLGSDEEIMADLNRIFEQLPDKNKVTQIRLKEEQVLKEAKKAQQEANRKQKEAEKSFKLAEEKKKTDMCIKISEQYMSSSESERHKFLKQMESLNCTPMKDMVIESKDEISCASFELMDYAVRGMEFAVRGMEMDRARFSGWMQGKDCKNITEGMDLKVIKTQSFYKSHAGYSNGVLVKLPNGMTTWIAR